MHNISMHKMSMHTTHDTCRSGAPISEIVSVVPGTNDLHDYHFEGDDFIGIINPRNKYP